MPTYLGLDSSTQGIKAIVIDTDAGTILQTASVNYGDDLPGFSCPDGVLDNGDPLIKHADPLLWIAGLELVLKRLQESGLSMDEIAGIGGDGQQHGSVYLNNRFFNIVKSLDSEQPLTSQLAPALSRKTSPIWMDSSTTTECQELEDAVGSRLQADTGSPAIERFTGAQIRKFHKECPEHYAATARIHLVSSFLCSLLIGDDASIDSGDGAGMNLLNLRTLSWDPEIAEATAPGLINKLPAISTGKIAGKLHPYFAKYGLKPGIPVAVWTGDNPASLIGTGAWKPGVAVVSLGTSDTFFAAMDRYHTDPDGCGHVFGNPAGGFMCLTCFKNGSLARDRIRQEANMDWKGFDKDSFLLTPPGNNEHLALPWFVPEITPPVATPGIRANFELSKAAPETQVRAVVEGQILAMRLHSLWIGEFKTIRVTGGASKSPGIRQVLADVFQATVETIAVADSGALGSAMLAAHITGKIPLASLTDAFSPVTEATLPNPNTQAIYQQLLPIIHDLERAQP